MDHAIAAALLDMSRAEDSPSFWRVVSNYLNEFALADFLRVMRRQDGIINDKEVIVYDTTDQEWRKYYQEKDFKQIDPLARILHKKEYGVFCWGSEKLKRHYVEKTSLLETAIKKYGDHTGAFGAHVNFPSDGYTMSISATFRHSPDMVAKRVDSNEALLRKFFTFSAVLHERMMTADMPDELFFDRLVVQLLLANGLEIRQIEEFGLMNETGVQLENPLSELQREIMLKVAEGHSTKEIAYMKAMSERMVNHALNQARDRLGARNRTQAVLRATTLGLLKPV